MAIFSESKIFLMAFDSVMKEIVCISDWHRGHFMTSTSNTRAIILAQPCLGRVDTYFWAPPFDAIEHLAQRRHDTLLGSFVEVESGPVIKP